MAGLEPSGGAPAALLGTNLLGVKIWSVGTRGAQMRACACLSRIASQLHGLWAPPQHSAMGIPPTVRFSAGVIGNRLLVASATGSRARRPAVIRKLEMGHVVCHHGSKLVEPLAMGGIAGPSSNAASFVVRAPRVRPCWLGCWEFVALRLRFLTQQIWWTEIPGLWGASRLSVSLGFGVIPATTGAARCKLGLGDLHRIYFKPRKINTLNFRTCR